MLLVIPVIYVCWRDQRLLALFSFGIGVKLTPECHGWLLGREPKMKRFALSKERKTELERSGEADLWMELAHTFCFFFFFYHAAVF